MSSWKPLFHVMMICVHFLGWLVIKKWEKLQKRQQHKKLRCLSMECVCVCVNPISAINYTVRHPYSHCG
jgi:hypothetical protein